MNRLLCKAIGLGTLLAASLATTAQAGVIGNWDGSSRSWNAGNTLVTLMQSRGHTVEADGGISAAGLAGDSVFVIGEATRTTTAKETADLTAWVNGGGRLLVTADSSSTGVSHGNAILAAIGSGLSFGGVGINGTLQTGSFLTDGGPFTITGSTLTVTPGTAVSGGTALAGNYVAMEAMGSGYVFGFGDHFTHEFFNNSVTNVNGQMHINLVEGDTKVGTGSGPSASAVPVPAPIAMLGAVAVGFGILARRKAKA